MVGARPSPRPTDLDAGASPLITASPGRAAGRQGCAARGFPHSPVAQSARTSPRPTGLDAGTPLFPVSPLVPDRFLSDPGCVCLIPVATATRSFFRPRSRRSGLAGCQTTRAAWKGGNGRPRRSALPPPYLKYPRSSSVHIALVCKASLLGQPRFCVYPVCGTHIATPGHTSHLVNILVAEATRNIIQGHILAGILQQLPEPHHLPLLQQGVQESLHPHPEVPVPAAEVVWITARPPLAPGLLGAFPQRLAGGLQQPEEREPKDQRDPWA
ncbi:hypothetical protein NDU88_007019 [Pleurodeles waltl]|uniref:Uncharacterized protein n=1 Tax=Pleurodeles waltl TaxID=8319 RepID=A0AAV7PP25_PLEWA|nr:hypothetical protein NDU88_007019 [Pleurodeles waltl]